jgi:hypothetical protein
MLLLLLMMMMMLLLMMMMMMLLLLLMMMMMMLLMMMMMMSETMCNSRSTKYASVATATTNAYRIVIIITIRVHNSNSQLGFLLLMP